MVKSLSFGIGFGAGFFLAALAVGEAMNAWISR